MTLIIKSAGGASTSNKVAVFTPINLNQGIKKERPRVHTCIHRRTDRQAGREGHTSATCSSYGLWTTYNAYDWLRIITFVYVTCISVITSK